MGIRCLDLTDEPQRQLRILSSQEAYYNRCRATGAGEASLEQSTPGHVLQIFAFRDSDTEAAESEGADQGYTLRVYCAEAAKVTPVPPDCD